MMGAVLQAPLAALMAIMELTVNPHILLPGMIAIVAASLTSRELFRSESVFITMLRARGVEYVNDPVAVSLQRTGVTAVMSRRFAHVQRYVAAKDLQGLLETEPRWLVVGHGEKAEALVDARTAATLLSRQDEDVDEATSLDLLGAGLKPQPLVTVRLQSTLNEALSQLDAHSADALAVTGSATLERRSIAGVLTRGDIEASVRFGSSRAGG